MDRKTYTISQRNGIWQLRLNVNVKGKNILVRESLHTRNKSEAYQIADERAEEIFKEYQFKLDKTQRKEITLDQAFGMYYEEHAQFCAYPRKEYTALALILDCFDKSLPLHLLDEDDISKFIADCRKQGNCNDTINRKLNRISAVYFFCKKRRIAVPDIDISTFKLKGKSHRTIYIKNKEDLQKIIDSAIDYFKPVIKFAVLTGFRAGNIKNLKWTDIDDNYITVYTKNCKYEGGKIQRKPIFPELRKLLDEQPRVSEYVFTNSLGTKIKHFSYPWREAMAKSGVPYVNFHALRHTHATWLIRKTNNIKLVSESLGHANINMTMRYAHLMENDTVDIMQSLFAS